MRKRVFRSDKEKVIGGVCGGLGEYFGIDPTWIRVLFVLSIFANGIGLIAYIIGWIVIPARRETADSGPAPAEVVSSEATPPAADPRRSSDNHKYGYGFLPGIVLVVLGMIFLFDRVFYWFDFDYIWPLVLIGIGVILIFRSARPKLGTERSVATSTDSLEVGNESQ